MAPLDHWSLSATFPSPSPCPLIVLLALCAPPMPLAHNTRADRVPTLAGRASARRRRTAMGSSALEHGREEAPARVQESSSFKGAALCPPTGPAPTVTMASLSMERFTRTTARTSPSFTPLIPGLIAGGIGITLVPQRPWIPHVPFRGPSTTTEPYFEEDNERNVTGRVGLTAYLDCKIEMQQELAVTWIHRKEDSIQLLTVGRHPYSADSRFLLSHMHPNNWRLKILPVMMSDEGVYECQIGTHPLKVKKVFFQVTAPELKIVDEDSNELLERHYKAGSKVKLTCLATQLEEEDGLDEEKGASATEEAGRRRQHEEKEGMGGDPAFNYAPTNLEGVVSRVVWRHGDSTISNSTTGKTLRPRVSADGRNASLTLTLLAVKPEDGGNYTCSLGVVSSAAVHIRILNGDSNGNMEDKHLKNMAVTLGLMKFGVVSNVTVVYCSILILYTMKYLILIK